MKLHLTKAVEQVILTLHTDHKNMEWQVFGKVEEIDGKVVVTDLFIPKQINTAGHTKTIIEDGKPDWREELIDHLIDRGGDHVLEVDKWRLWLHSHHAGQPGRSGDDLDCRLRLSGKDLYDDEIREGWLFSIVIGGGANIRYIGSLDVRIEDKIFSQEIDVVVGLDDSEYIEKEFTEEEVRLLKEGMVNKYGRENNLPGVIGKYSQEFISQYMGENIEEELKKEIDARKLYFRREFEVAKSDRNRAIEEQYILDGKLFPIQSAGDYLDELIEKEELPWKKNYSSYYDTNRTYAKPNTVILPQPKLPFEDDYQGGYDDGYDIYDDSHIISHLSITEEDLIENGFEKTKKNKWINPMTGRGQRFAEARISLYNFLFTV